jgi:hypothetical protein
MLALAACGGAPTAGGDGAGQAAAGAAAPKQVSFLGKSHIPVRLALKATADGGRAVPIRGSYRTQVVFADGQAQECAVSRGDLAELAPGNEYEVSLRCRDSLVLDAAALSFTVVEDGRDVATGTVLR